MAAAKTSDPKLRALALDGVKRVVELAQKDRELNALAVAGEYERQQRWGPARDEYASVAKTATGALLTRAIDGMQRMHARLGWQDRAATFDGGLVWLGRILGTFVMIWWLFRLARSIWTTRRSIKVFPFVGQSDQAAKEIVFWLAYVRASLRSAAPTSGAVLMSSWNLPLIDLPGLETSTVPQVEDPTLGGAKIPLKDLLSALGRARVRISGGLTSGTAGGRAYAEIERRRWNGYAVHATVTQPLSAGASQASDLELFSYDVLIRATEAHGT